MKLKPKGHIQVICIHSNQEFEKEYMFHPTRKWRFDWAFPTLKVAIEFEGIFSTKSRHTTVTGFTKDTEKYNAAAILGWKVLRYTAMNYTDVQKDLNQIIKQSKV